MSIAIVGFWIFECLSFSIILIEADDFAVEGLLMVPFFFFFCMREIHDWILYAITYQIFYQMR